MDHDRREQEMYTPSAQMQQDEYYRRALEDIERAKLRRQRADQLAKDRLHAELIMIGAAVLIIILIAMMIIRAGKKKQQQAEFLSSTVAQASASQPDNGLEDDSQPAGKTVPEYQGDGKAVDSSESGESPYKGQAEGHSLVTKNGVTYVDGILIVNKTFSLPKDYAPGVDPAAQKAFDQMATAAWTDGYSLWVCSGYRTFEEQEQLFDGYASARGLAEADDVSARPGHSEHQSGLCFDLNSTDFDFANTGEAQWLDAHCAEYGFIIRFPQGKESFTGYAYEPWHIRYVGVEAAQAMKASGQCLEEYLGVTSDYNDSLENEDFVKKYSGIGDGAADDGITQAETGAGDQTYDGGYQQHYNYDNNYNYDNGYQQDYNYDYNNDYNYDNNNDNGWGY